MMPLPKVVALASLAGAVITDAMLSLVNTAPLNAGDAIGGGLTGGAVVGAVAWATYKQKVDQHAEEIRQLKDGKADKDALEQHGELLKEVRDDVRWLVRQKGGRE